jgi:5-methylthioadenosine/S-adenosylhomocysteine deaminase
MTDVLITGGTVVTMNKERRVIREGCIAIEDNKIVELGEAGDMKQKHEADMVIEAKGRLVLPGFVNVHTHTPTPFVRGLFFASDIGWKLIGGIRAAYKELGSQELSDIFYRNSLAGCLELLNSGFTTIKDNYDMAENIAKAVAKIGLRGMVSELVAEVDVAKIAHDVWEYHPDTAREELRKSVRLMEEWDGKENGRITTAFSPQAPDMVTKEILEEFLQVAREHGKLTTIHLCQSLRELRQVRKLYGKSPVEHLRDIGMVGPDVLAAHCIYTNDVDTGILASTDTRIMHCPTLQVSRGGPLAPVVDWLRSGVKFGVGTDNSGLNHDVFTALRMMLIIVNQELRSNPYYTNHRKYALTPMAALELATIKGAEILGMDNEIGSIEVGKKADLITVNMMKPHLTPLIDPIATLVWHGNGSDVEMVMVDGRILKDEEGVKTVDEQEVLSKGQEDAERLMTVFFEINPDLKDHSYFL